jgi:hypothetical protein
MPRTWAIGPVDLHLELGGTRVRGALVSLIVTINAWNAIGVSTRAWPVGV